MKIASPQYSYGVGGSQMHERDASVLGEAVRACTSLKALSITGALLPMSELLDSSVALDLSGNDAAGRMETIKGAFGRGWAVGMRIRAEQARTVSSSKKKLIQ